MTTTPDYTAPRNSDGYIYSRDVTARHLTTGTAILHPEGGHKPLLQVDIVGNYAHVTFEDGGTRVFNLDANIATFERY